VFSLAGQQLALDLFLAGARGLGLSDLEYRQVVQLKLARHQQRISLAWITALKFADPTP